jgi:hypothetical protein
MITGVGEERREQVISISKPTDFERIEYSQWDEENRDTKENLSKKFQMMVR